MKEYSKVLKTFPENWGLKKRDWTILNKRKNQVETGVRCKWCFRIKKGSKDYWNVPSMIVFKYEILVKLYKQLFFIKVRSSCRSSFAKSSRHATLLKPSKKAFTTTTGHEVFLPSSTNQISFRCVVVVVVAILTRVVVWLSCVPFYLDIFSGTLTHTGSLLHF
jgi:hypothetical protein